MAESPSRPFSPEPWKQDARDLKTVLDAHARLVAVTTSREDAARIVAGVNAARGLTAEGLAEAPLSDAVQVLYEICLYHSDVKFRNHVDRRGGIAALLERADKAWRVFGDDAFHADGAPREKEKTDSETVPEPESGAAPATSPARTAPAAAASAVPVSAPPAPAARRTTAAADPVSAATGSPRGGPTASPLGGPTASPLGGSTASPLGAATATPVGAAAATPVGAAAPGKPQRSEAPKPNGATATRKPDAPRKPPEK